jgi:CheY-like chemotaxis protein
VVDDCSSLRFMLRLLLEEAGIEVEEAVCGSEALERLGRPGAGLPDTVVVDQRMPGLSGIELARELIARGPHPRLVLFTSYLDPALEHEARQLGMTTVLKTDLTTLVAELGGAGHRLAA